MVRSGLQSLHLAEQQTHRAPYPGSKAKQTVSLFIDLGTGCGAQGHGLRVLPARPQLPGRRHSRERQEEERGREEKEKQEEGKHRQ